MHTESVQAGKRWVSMVAQYTQGNGLKGLVGLSMGIINHSKVLHRRRGAVDLISALGDQSVVRRKIKQKRDKVSGPFEHTGTKCINKQCCLYTLLRLCRRQQFRTLQNPWEQRSGP